jgi:hypothetical protein
MTLESLYADAERAALRFNRAPEAIRRAFWASREYVGSHDEVTAPLKSRLHRLALARAVLRHPSHVSVASMAKAIDVPRGTVSSWRSRDPAIAASLRKAERDDDDPVEYYPPFTDLDVATLAIFAADAVQRLAALPSLEEDLASMLKGELPSQAFLAIVDARTLGDTPFNAWEDRLLDRYDIPEDDPERLALIHSRTPDIGDDDAA